MTDDEKLIADLRDYADEMKAIKGPSWSVTVRLSELCRLLDLAERNLPGA